MRIVSSSSSASKIKAAIVSDNDSQRQRLWCVLNTILSRVRFIGSLNDYPELKKNDFGVVIEDYEDGNY